MERRFSRRKRLSHLLRAGVVALSLVVFPPGSALAQGQGPATSPAGPDGGGRESFIVVLKEGAVGRAAPVAAEHATRFGADVRYVYEHALKGYAAQLDPSLVGALAADARVAYVERDGVATTMATQTGATWGLDRIDARSGLDNSYVYTNTGTSVTAYIIDTGIRYDHTDFGGRATFGYDSFGGDGKDCNGHGTHVAGTVGGTTYGVAKGVTLKAVRVLDCGGSGTWSGVIAGIDWVVIDHNGTPAVANMSLGGGANSAVDDAVRGMIKDGVATAVAAGNGNRAGIAQDACKSSPARVTEAMTIGATDKADKKTSWSNYGNCVDWFAPGAGITSAWHTSTTDTNTISGTSMATPHTAGVAALYLESNKTAAPEQVRNVLYDLTTKGVVTSSKTANNHLLYTNY